MFTSLRYMFFTSLNFRTFVNEREEGSNDVSILFEPDHSFMTKFYTIAIKPIGLIVNDNDGKEKVLSHRQVLSMCDGKQPIVCFHPGLVDIVRGMPLQGIVLKTPVVGKKGYTYCPMEGYKGMDAVLYNNILFNKVWVIDE